MTRRIPAALVLLVLLGGCSSPNGPAETTDTATTPNPNATELESLQQRAEQGDGIAQSDLGLLYDIGQGVPQDDVQAVAWYRKAAEQGQWQAQSNLGEMYENGRGVPQDDVQAVAWYRKAAEQGHVRPQHSLASMYANGEGVPQDDVEAHKWYNLAASRTLVPTSQKRYAELRDLTAKRMTPQQIAEAQGLAREWQAAFEKRQPD